jgi:hypothetical protein
MGAICQKLGIATRYGLDWPGIEFRWRQDFPHPFKPALGPTQPPIRWIPGLSRGWIAHGVAFTTHSIYRQGYRKSRAIPLLHLWAFVACSRATFTFTFTVCQKENQNEGENINTNVFSSIRTHRPTECVSCLVQVPFLPYTNTG